MRVAINGFGRIGRSILRALATTRGGEGVEVALLNDLAPLETCAYLFEYDSTFGPFPGRVEMRPGALALNGAAIPFHHAPDLSALDLSGIDVVLECTGWANTRDVAERGLRAGAEAVLISGPSVAADVTVVTGANDAALTDQAIVSNASCTTNAVAPLLKLLDDLWGVESAHMTTIHCYTGSQPTVDAPREDLARSRAAALSMVPTTTSATKLVEHILPHLKGRTTGAAVRVPTASVSAVDLTARLARRPEDFTERLRAACAASPVLGWTDRPLVSSDLRARPESLVLAGPETLCGPEMTRLFGWYDNEWGFANRIIDVARRMARRDWEENTNVA
ncbi:NAD-dependent glyceraldehyde-3-phosphate dehydrogenase [Rubellimicrobium mesophilum DSM 19309]|uniref:NAD-dependent glyceraldehyde-3-phosphate dehydrogenase n=1 Tax=Rubellimicrobium mesophilum DSM 19309 TaxID=442562 RepID=A0A017HIB7_9RHOB|nr:glyceraldehyde 3-phosphate dehydrogenase NAD-binding domain-containing protein [Rubellimicrobium mesophilum]EYD74262.1 NAD-dependent glyceraldehyde-3-phosphate dehydrogenase [Rubellimicrobium mesophilum DSM 19309]